MSLITQSDQARLLEIGMPFLEVEEGTNRFLILTQYPLKNGMYQVDQCEVLIVIPANYPQAGNDMFWVYPQLKRLDGKPIPGTSVPQNEQQGDPRFWNGKRYDRWSRHWPNPPHAWRPGKDDIDAILNRLSWCLENPDCKK